MLRLLLSTSIVALGLVPSFAEDKLPDFDRQAPSVSEIVTRSREAARSDTSDAAGGQVRTGKEAAPQDSVERRIVSFKKGTGVDRMKSVVQASGGVVVKDLWLIDAVAVVMPKTRIAAFDRSVESFSEVRRVEPDKVQNWLKKTGDAVVAGCPWYWPWCGDDSQETPWGVTRVNAPAAWPVTRGAGVKVAVIDTGVDTDHPDLRVSGGHNALDANASYEDDHGHGTHVAGTIAAQDNDKAVVGIAPDVQLYGVKVLSASGEGTYENIIDGIQWCVANGIQVGNMSLGGDEGTEALAEAVRNATAAGLVIVAAAGNNGGAVGYPAKYPETIAVAASNSKDGTAYFSSRGPEVDFIAPGVSVKSTYKGGSTSSLSGTSMASPHVAGLAALAVAAHGLQGAEQVRAALQRAAAPIPGTPAEQQGAGMIDAGKLVR